MTFDEAAERRITTPCPSCGSRTLFIGAGGHLTCSLLGCKDPSPQRVYERALAEIARLRKLAATRKVALVAHCQGCPQCHAVALAAALEDTP